MDLIHGSSKIALEENMRFRVARSAVLAGNIANVDTPGYRRRELHFEDSMNQATIRLDRTDSSHLSASASSTAEGYRVEIGPKGTRPDGNGVNLDQEVIAMHRNAGGFSSKATVLGRLGSLTRTAITGG